ncbi:MAG TPA: O-antigen ligase family protein [bacterium]|nr:O-antigen ligase family protein [bacterium]HOM26441.1 O-antigen ligase family protein [bacterium]
MKKKEIINKIYCYILSSLIFCRFLFDGITYPKFNLFFTISIFLLFIVFTLLNFQKLEFTYVEVLILLFSFFSIISSFLSEIKGTGIRYNSYIVSYLCLFFLVRNIFRDKEKSVLIYIILFTVFTLTLYGIYQRFWGIEATRKYLQSQESLEQNPEILKYLSPTFFDRMESNRIYSTFVYPNIYASFLISIMPFLFFLFLNEDKKYFKIFSVLLFLLCFINLIFTESMGGLLIFLFISHIILLQLLLNEKKFKRILTFLIFFEFLFLYLGYHFKVLPHIHSLLDRITYWKGSMKIIQKNIFMGVGPENFRYYFLKYKSPEGLEAAHAHNFLIETFAENGFIGVIFLMSFLFIIILNPLKERKKDFLSNGVFYLLLTFFLHNLIDFDFSDPSVAILFFIFGGFYEYKDKFKIKGLTKPLLCFIIILYAFNIFELSKFENSERYRRYSEIEENLDVKLYLLDYAENQYNKNFEVYFEKGNLYTYMWRLTEKDEFFEQAILNYEKSIHLNPYLVKSYRRLAYIYESKGNYEKAEEMYLKVLEKYPNKKLYNLEIAKFYKKIGNEDKFKYYFQKAKQLKEVTIEEKLIIEEVEKWIELQK